MSGDREERIRKRAHEIWDKEGRPEGDGYRHWAQAESEIDAEGAKAPAKKKAPAAKPAAAKPAAAKPASAKAAPAPKKPAAKKPPKIFSAK